MGLLHSVRVLLGGGRPVALAHELREREASRELWRFASDFGSDVRELWAACPRGTWCLEIAARFGIDRGLVVQATRDLTAAATPGDAQTIDQREWAPGASTSRVDPAVLDAVTLAAAEFAAGSDVEAFLVQIEALSYAIIETQESVRESRHAMESAREWGRFDDRVEASDAYDVAYAAAHAELADLVRRRVDAEAVRAALRGHSAHPYR